MINYTPSFQRSLPKSVDVPTAWDGVESAIPALIRDFHINPRCALEFGVDYAYSTVALANYFETVIGVDTFFGDINAGDRGEHGIYDQVVEIVKPFENIVLVKSDFREFIALPHPQFDLIHVDIVHNFEQTYQCGRWSVDHAPVVIFHDTLAFRDVMQAVTAIADETGCEFYNWNYKHGLGILVRQ